MGRDRICPVKPWCAAVQGLQCYTHQFVFAPAGLGYAADRIVYSEGSLCPDVESEGLANQIVMDIVEQLAVDSGIEVLCLQLVLLCPESVRQPAHSWTLEPFIQPARGPEWDVLTGSRRVTVPRVADFRASCVRCERAGVDGRGTLASSDEAPYYGPPVVRAGGFDASRCSEAGQILPIDGEQM